MKQKYKVGQRIQSTYCTSEGRFLGVVEKVIVNKNSPDTSTRFRYKVRWDHGRIETVGQNRIERRTL